MQIKDTHYIGVNDHEIDLFEGQYVVPEGMAYNSYLIKDTACAVLDTVDRRFTEEWLKNLADALGDRVPDYLIVQHMEPDHSASIAAFLARYPEAKVVATLQAFHMMKNFFASDYAERRVAVKDADTLCLGEHTLTFFTAPMVHWPEVMLTYDALTQTLFSADAFGKFGALDSADEDWACEARRYYFGIVGKYGAQVQALLKKLGATPLSAICPLHGPVLTDTIGECVALYDTWSSYRPEERGVLIAYASMYGNTKQAAEELAAALKEAGETTIALVDLAREDMAETVEDAFRYDRMVLAAPTYNMGVFPVMRTFITHLVERNYQNRTVALIENGSWAPAAAKVMREMFASSKDITFTENAVRITSALNSESRTAIRALAAELVK